MARPRGKNSRLWRFSHTTVEVEQIFDKLSDDAMTKFNVHAVQVAANTLKKDVKAKFLERLPAADGSKRTAKSHYSDTLLDAVRQQKNDSAMARSNGQFGRTFVHILGVNASSSGTFRARFFENGTVERETGADYKDSIGRLYPAGQRRGKLKALNYLKDATNEFNMRVDVEKCLVSYIQGINHTKGGTQI